MVRFDFRRLKPRRGHMWFAATLLIAAGIVGLYLAYLPPAWFLHTFARFYPDVLFDVRTSEPLIALTIDDAPHPDVTPQLLDILRQHDARATFFILGEHAEAYPELLQSIRAAGHEVANHMFTDRKSVGLPTPVYEQELLRTQELLEPLTGQRWCRPGYGIIDRRTLDLMLKHDFIPTLGSAYPLDLRLPEYFASQQFLIAARPGAILVLHDGAKRTRTLRILERVLPQLTHQGYSFVTLTELTTVASPGS